MKYSDTFKSKVVRRMTGPEGLSATALSTDIGISQPTLSRWLREAASGKVSAMPKTKTKKDKRPQDWTPGEKIAAVAEAGGLSDEELGAFVRRKGLHQAQLETWQTTLIEALSSKPPRQAKASPEKRRVRELEKELRRKDKALAETAALLVLKKNHPGLERPTCGLETWLGVVSVVPTGGEAASFLVHVARKKTWSRDSCGLDIGDASRDPV